MSYFRAAALLLLAAPARASAPHAGLPALITPAVQEELERIRAAAPRWQSVSLRVWASGSSFTISDSFWKVNLHGYPSSGGRHSFSGNAGDKHLYLSASPSFGTDPRKGFWLNGGGVNVTVSASGSGWRVWGSAGSENLSFNLSPLGDGFNIWGLNGASLHISRGGSTYWISGQADSSRFGPVSLAALGSIVAVLGSVPAQPAAVSEGTIRASWKPYGLHGGPRRDQCVSALYAVADVLEMTDARNQRKACSWNYGLRADWESLTPLKDGEQAGEVVQAVWKASSMQRNMAGGDCYGYMEALDRVLERLPVRKVQQSVYCNGGSGFISLSFEYLAEP